MNNHMADVAAMFGKDLREAFAVKDYFDGTVTMIRLTEDGAEFYLPSREIWIGSVGLLVDLVLGEVEVLE